MMTEQQMIGIWTFDLMSVDQNQ